jgi:hypothetical protein
MADALTAQRQHPSGAVEIQGARIEAGVVQIGRDELQVFYCCSYHIAPPDLE